MTRPGTACLLMLWLAFAPHLALAQTASPVRQPVAAHPARAQRESIAVQLVEGLTIVTAVGANRGDYESIKQVTGVDDREVRLSYSSRTPQPDGRTAFANVPRRVRREDLRVATRYRISFVEGDDELLPGATALGVSATVLEELKTRGAATLTLVDQPSGGILGAILSEATGTELAGRIERVEPRPVALSVLVAGERVSLPAIHARGQLGNGYAVKPAEFWFLDDPGNPLALRFSLGSGTLRVVRIDYPAVPRIEQALAKRDTAVVFGLYFEFASAEIRPESQPVLHQISDMMRRHLDWSLRIAGHTDSIGGAASNLDLSRRRAEAVKAALVKQGIGFGRLATAGYGAAAPKESNATLEGRARNRRVELTRMEATP